MSRPPERAGPHWLGSIPDDWEVCPAKALFNERREACLADDVHLTPSQVYGVLPQREYMKLTGNKVVLNLGGQDKMKHVEPNDFIIHLRSFQGGLERSQYAGKVSTAYTVLSPRNGVLPGYFRWLLKSDAYVQELRTTTNQLRDGQSIRFADFSKVPLPAPSAAEQRAIASFLDRETSKIDALIAEQQRLIKLLRERRQAVIDNGIASAPAPNVQLRRAIRFLTSGSRGWGSYYAESGQRFLRIGNLPRTSLDLRGEVQFVDLPQEVTEGERTRLQRGDLLFSITAYLGSVAVVDQDWVGGYVSQHVALCRLDNAVLDPLYVGWVMLSTEGQHQLKMGAAGGTKLQLALDDIRGLVVPLVDLDTQCRAAGALSMETARIDELIAETEQFIELSKERRAALITAAVTGEIDVRGEVA